MNKDLLLKYIEILSREADSRIRSKLAYGTFFLEERSTIEDEIDTLEMLLVYDEYIPRKKQYCLIRKKYYNPSINKEQEYEDFLKSIILMSIMGKHGSYEDDDGNKWVFYTVEELINKGLWVRESKQ